MTFANTSQIGGAVLAGRVQTTTIRKSPTQATTAGWWSDLSMVGSPPVPNYYVGGVNESTVLNPANGIQCGPDGATKFLTALSLVTPTAGLVGAYRLLDYLLFYPFIDGNETATQTMLNTTPLPRYADGQGVRCMAVATAPTTGGGSFVLNYRNAAGADVVSAVIPVSTAVANIGQIITSAPGDASLTPGTPFLPLADGIVQINDVTFITPCGGLIALVLVKSLCDAVVREASTPTEVTFPAINPSAPVIEDDAYLNLICQTSASIAGGVLVGSLQFVWSQ